MKKWCGHFRKARLAIEGRGINPPCELIEQEVFQRGCGIKEMLQMFTPLIAHNRIRVFALG